jgi:hypothetical protein
MIKIAANISKKVPLPGVDYSSQQFGASLEIEVSDKDTPDAIQARLRELYALLGRTVEEQICIVATSTPGPRNGQTTISHRDVAHSTAPAEHHRNGNGNGRRVYATDAQKRAISSICKAEGITVDQALADAGAADVNQLTISAASKLIDHLKARQQPRQ